MTSATMVIRSLLLLLCVGVVCSTRVVQDYEINLDLPPQERYQGLFKLPHTNFNATVWKFYDTYFAKDKLLQDVLYGLLAKRGPEPAEMQGEIEGLAAESGLPLQFVATIQMLYELQTLMVPIVNFTGPGRPQLSDYPKGHFPPGYEALSRIPWRGPGCTGVIALNTADKSVYHARNLDFSPVDIMTELVYNGIFTKGGKEVFRSQMVAGYTQVITGANMVGSDGYAVERNTRYTDHVGGNKLMLENLEKGAPLNGWQLRKVLETYGDYASAVQAISTVPYVSTEYAIISGVGKGCILSRDPGGVAHAQVLGQHNFEERDDYIIMTNFDFFWHDIREWFDPTGGDGMFHPRRLAAQKVLNASSVITSDVLWNTINSKGDFADTIFQAIINVEHKLWNISQPDVPSKQRA